MNKSLILIIAAVLIIGGLGWLFLGLSDDTIKSGSASEADLEKAPEFALKDYNGNTVSLSDFAGSPVVINSWAAWCPFCVAEMLDFAEAQGEFGDKVKIILINRAESTATAKKFSDEVGVTDRLTLLLDQSDSFYRSIGGFSMPETIFVNTSGEIVIHKRGPMDLAEIRNKINQLING